MCKFDLQSQCSEHTLSFGLARKSAESAAPEMIINFNIIHSAAGSPADSPESQLLSGVDYIHFLAKLKYYWSSLYT